jgi:hypothetical protein
VQVEGEQPVSSTFCAAAHPVVQPRIGKCSRYEVVRTAAGAIESDSTCVDTDGATWVLHGVVVGDPNTAFTQDGTMKIYARGAASPRVINGHMSFRYLGACPPGAKPTPGP